MSPYDELDHEVNYGVDRNRPRIIRRWQLDNLVGRLLTYIDATYSDQQQRKAHKDIVKQAAYNWFMDASYDFLADGTSVEDAVNELYEKHNSIPIEPTKAEIA